MTDTPHLTYETDGPVAIITLSRPDAMNAVSARMRTEIAWAQKQAEDDRDIRVIILTGEGRAFSAGTDLKEGTRQGNASVTEHILKDYKPLIDAIGDSGKIYMAAINGVCAGVSLGMALNCDLAIMAEEAFLFMPFANIGLIPDGGSSWLFLQQLGYKRAFSAIMEGTQLDGQFCLEHGLVNRVVPKANIRQTAIDWAKSLAEKAPLSATFTKQILRAGQDLSFDEAIKFEAECQHYCEISKDSQEGIQAFKDKRKPVFKGH